MKKQFKWYIMYCFCIVYFISNAQNDIVKISINSYQSNEDIVFSKQGQGAVESIKWNLENGKDFHLEFILPNNQIDNLKRNIDSIEVKLGTSWKKTYTLDEIINKNKDSIIDDKIKNLNGETDLIVDVLLKNNNHLIDTLLVKWRNDNADIISRSLNFFSSPTKKPNIFIDKFGENDNYYKGTNKVVYHYYNGSTPQRGYYKTYFNKGKKTIVCEPVNFNKETVKSKANVMFKIHNVNRYLYDVSVDKQVFAYGSELNEQIGNLLFGSNVDNLGSVIQNTLSETISDLETFVQNYTKLYDYWQSDIYGLTKPDSIENRIRNISRVGEQRDILAEQLGVKKTKEDSLTMNALPKQDLFSEMKKFYAEFEDHFSYTINHINLRKGNHINLDIKITPKIIDGINLNNSKGKLFKDSIGFEDNIYMPIVEKFFFSFSTGTYFTWGNNLREVEYKWVNIPDFNGGFTGKHQLMANEITQNFSGLSAYVNDQYRISENFGVGLSFGLGIGNHQLSSITSDFDPTYLIGASAFFGSDRQFIVTAGIAWSKLKVLNTDIKYFYDNMIILEDTTSLSITNSAYHKQTKSGWFIALSYTPFKHHKVEKGRVIKPKKINKHQ